MQKRGAIQSKEIKNLMDKLPEVRENIKKLKYERKWDEANAFEKQEEYIQKQIRDLYRKE